MKKLKSLLALAVVVAGVYATWMVLPAYFSNYQFQDAIESEARLSAVTSKSEEVITDAVFKAAQELELPLRREQIKVRRDGSEVIISAAYTVHVDLPGYPLDLKFAPVSKGKRIP